MDALKAFIEKVKSLFRGKAAREAYGTDMATLEECAALWQKAYTAAEKQAGNAKTAAHEGNGVKFRKFSLKNNVKMTEQSGNSDTSTVNNSISTSSEKVNEKFQLKSATELAREVKELKKERRALENQNKVQNSKKRRPTASFPFAAPLGIHPTRGCKLRLPVGKTAKEKDALRRLFLLVPRRGFTPQGGVNFDSPRAKQQKKKTP